MKIQNIFERDVTRDINGVIKADQTDDMNRWVELDEYVVTKEIQKCLEDFFTGYNSQDSNCCGVWIKGFFGSGKSHLIKILSYLLENKPVTNKDGVTKTPLQFFNEKIEDGILMGEITKAVQNSNTDVVLFNIDTVANQFSNVMLSAFQSVFDAKMGYCKKYGHIAELERFLDAQGKLENFVSNIKAAGKDWYQIRDEGIAFHSKAITDALASTLGITPDAAKEMIDVKKKEYALSVESFVSSVEQYLKANPKKRIAFFVDEISQFIGTDNGKMLTLQSIAEMFATRCKGRAWLVVTAQAAIDSVFQDGKGEQFSKIFDRFRIKISLSSSNVDEVIRQRLLKKTPEAIKELESIYKSKGEIVNNQTIFSGIAQAYKHIDSAEDFAACYPFLPYQFSLVQKVFEGISKRAIGGLYLSNGARSLLDSFQRAIHVVKDEQCDKTLVPLYTFYAPISEFLNTKILGTIRQSEENDALNDFDRNLLKTLLLIRVVDDMPGTIDNLNILTISEMDVDKLAQRDMIDKSLNRLESQNLINHNGDKYYFLTDEEQDVAKEIQRQNISNAELDKFIGDTILTNLYADNNRFRYKPNGKNFTFDLKYDEQWIRCNNTEDLHVSIVPASAGYDNSKCVLTSSGCDCGLLICYKDDKKLLQEITKFLKVKKYLTANNSNSVLSDRKQIYTTYQTENAERNSNIINELKTLMVDADYYVAGNAVNVSGNMVREVLDNALEKVIDANYHKLKMLERLSADPNAEIASLLRDDSALGLGVSAADTNPQARQEVETYLQLLQQRSAQVVLKELVEKFGTCPYGWPEGEVLLILVRMHVCGQINFVAQGRTLDPSEIISYTSAGPRKWNEVTIVAKTQIGDSVLQKARVLLRDLFGKMITADQDEVCQYAKDALNGCVTRMNEIRSIINTHKQWPGLDIIDKYMPEIAGLVQNSDQAIFINKLLENEKLLKEFMDSYELIDGFYRNNAVAWGKAESALQQYQLNKSYLNADEQIEELSGILSDPEPYSKVSKVNKLVDAIAAKQQDVVKEYRIKATSQVDAVIEQVHQDMKTNGVDGEKDLSNKCLMPLQTLRSRIADEESIISLDNEYMRRATNLREDALDAINEHLKDKKQKMIASRSKTVFVQQHIKAEDPYLKTKEDVKKFIASLEKEMEEIIAKGDYVVIK